MNRLTEFFDTPRGRAVVVAVSSGLLAIVAVAFLFRAFFGPSDAVRRANARMFICSETRRTFEVTIKEGMTIPVHSPHSGKETGWPAELCYWRADGSTKKEPTPVLLNTYVGKKGPTFCPDCGRLVVGHNPLPMPGMKPPPTEAEYARDRPAAGAAKRDSRP